jgi:hypothetical protein
VRTAPSKNATALHEHDIEDRGEMASVLRTGQQAIDKRLSLVRRGIFQKAADLIRRGDDAGKVQINAAKELGVGGGSGGVAGEIRLGRSDGSINAPMQGNIGECNRWRKGQQAQENTVG